MLNYFGYLIANIAFSFTHILDFMPWWQREEWTPSLPFSWLCNWWVFRNYGLMFG